MAWTHFRIIIHPTGEIYISDDPDRGFMSPKQFIESYTDRFFVETDGRLYLHPDHSWISLDQREGNLYIDFGEPSP